MTGWPLALVASAALSAASCGQQQSPDPSSASGLAACVVEHGGEACVALVGGSSRGQELTSVQLYRPSASKETERWQRLPDLPAPRALHAVASDGKSIYVFGGLSRGDSFVDAPLLLRLDRDEPAWEELPFPPRKRNRHAAVYLDGTIYVVGGIEVARDVAESEATVCGASVDLLDLESMTWREGPPMPTGRHGHTISALDGKLYVVGGYGPGGQTPAVEVFDPDEGSWSSIAPLPEPRGFHATGVVGRRIIIIGGRVLTRTTYVLDAEQNLWSEGAAIPALRNRFAAAVATISGRQCLLAFGGEDRKGRDLPLEPLVLDQAEGVWRGP